MITKQKKQELVAELVELFKGCNGFYLVDYTGLTVAETIHFRRELSKEGIKFKVAKNTLIDRALKESGYNQVPDHTLVLATGIAFLNDKLSVPAKVIKEMSVKTEKPKLKGAVIEGQFYDSSRLKELSELPTREDMIASIIGSINAPISGIVGSLNAIMRDLLSVIEEAVKKNAA